MSAGTKARARAASGYLTLLANVVPLGVFAAFRLWQALLAPQGIWQDSFAYEASAANPILSWGFWAGSRPPLAPLLWKLTGTPTSFVAVQTSLAVIAWGFLAVTVGGLAASSWRRLLATAAVLAFACTLTVTEWDWSVLSESLALASLAAIFAFSIRCVRSTGRLNVTGLLCAATAFALARDEDIWTVALIGILGLAVSLVLALRSRSTGVPGETWILAALGAALVCVALVTEIPAVASQRDVTNITDNLVVRIFPYPSRVAWFAGHGMPDAAQIDQVASKTVTAPGTAPVVGIDSQTTEFAALDNWISADGPGTYALWLVEHPAFLFGAPFAEPPLTFNDADGDIGFYSAPDRISTSTLDRILFPAPFGELGTLAIALAFVWRRSAWRKEVWVLWALGAIGPVSMLLAWQGDGQEVTRHMVEGSVETRLAVLLFLLVAALAPSTTSKRREQAAPTDPPVSSASPGGLPRVPESPPEPAPAVASGIGHEVVQIDG